jgi:hypothetical protein
MKSNEPMNLSLDGYIEAKGQDDGLWLRIDEEVHRVFSLGRSLTRDLREWNGGLHGLQFLQMRPHS